MFVVDDSRHHNGNCKMNLGNIVEGNSFPSIAHADREDKRATLRITRLGVKFATPNDTWVLGTAGTGRAHV